MAITQAIQSSIFEQKTIQDVYNEIREIYLRFPQPWVIGYSGGKDSTTVLQLVWKAIETLAPAQRQKPVFVVASDTRVETPVIVDYIDTTLRRINDAARAQGMPFHSEKVVRPLEDSFWVNLIGKGYPAPTTRFRWCTDRLKISPVNRFVQEKVAQYGDVIMILGVRKAESATRAQLMQTYQVKGHVLRRHSSLPGAYVYAPIADFATDDVWSYLLQVQSPWGNNNRDLAALYRNANSGECPLVVDTSTPSCGNSRFGCWVCTVAQRDTSMEGLIDNGEEWMEPLLEFREWLSVTTDPARKREFRDIKGRDGRVILKKDGTPAARTFTLAASKQALEKLLNAQKTINDSRPNSKITLIEEEELHEIRKVWRTERRDWDDSVPQIYRSVYGDSIEWPSDDDSPFHYEQKAVLERACREHDVPFDLMAKLMDAERRMNGMARRAGIQKALSRVLEEEWRSEEDILTENSE